MSKRDVNLYFLQIKEQYKEAKEALDDINEAYNEGGIDEENVRAALADMQAAQLVYDTAVIFMAKLNKPSAKHKNALDQVAKDWYEYIEDKAREGIVNESVNVINDLIRIKKECKK